MEIKPHSDLKWKTITHKTAAQIVCQGKQKNEIHTYF